MSLATRKVLGAVVLALGSALGCGTPTEEPPAAGTAPATSADRADSIEPSRPADPPDRARVDSLTRMFYDGELDALFATFSEGLKQDLTLERLALMRQQVAEQYGSEVGIIGHDSGQQGEYRAFVRWARFDRSDKVIGVEWYLRDDGTVAAFYVRPARRKAPPP